MKDKPRLVATNATRGWTHTLCTDAHMLLHLRTGGRHRSRLPGVVRSSALSERLHVSFGELVYLWQELQFMT